MSPVSATINFAAGFRKQLLATIVGCSIACFAIPALASDLEAIVNVQNKKLELAQASQKTITKLTEERRSLYDQYKTVLKETEGMKVYNERLNKQVLAQVTEMERISNSIDSVSETQRQITPLMLRMIQGLAQFIALDMPFLLQERQERIARLERLIDSPNVSVAEKFRSIIQAYQIEEEYGRTIEAYSEILPNIDGAERKVNILRAGRIAMIYQTPDSKYSGYWDNQKQAWVASSSSADRSNFAKAINIANKQSAPDLIILPVEAPEAVK